MFDYALATEINRKILLRIVTALLVMAGTAETVTRRVHLDILSALRPAEAATRRLIAIMARAMVVTPPATRAAPDAPVPKGDGERMPAFPLFDPRRNVDPKKKRVPGYGPSVRGFDDVEYFPPAKPKQTPDDPVSATRIQRRLRAIAHALGDLRRQARRLVRARQKLARPIRPMRPGRPPGHRESGTREIDIVLADCHWLALEALGEAEAKPPDKDARYA